MSRLAKPLTVAALALVLAARPATGQLWYNGNWDGSQIVLPSDRDLGIPDTRIFDDFLVGASGWNVTSIFGDFISGLSPAQAYWEIRSGVSAGNGGTLLYSGTNTVSWLLLGPGLWDKNEYRATVSGLNLSLSAGTYWLSIAPILDGFERAYITTTGGGSGVNSLLDGNSYWASQTYAKNFQSTYGFYSRNLDFSYGVGGQLTTLDVLSVVTPEPGTFVLMASGLVLVGAAALRRRRHTIS